MEPSPAADAARPDRKRVELYLRLWRDEQHAAALYRELAALSEGDRRTVFGELAEVEEQHAAHWGRLLEAAGRTPTLGRRPLRTRMLYISARRFGVDRVLPTIIKAEAADSGRYRDIPEAPAQMADEETGHGQTLAAMAGDSAGAGLAVYEGRHRRTSGGSLRAGVFGVNDGLVSNLALIMGVAGGTSDASTVVLAGVAGLVAGAGSMAAGEWISVQSQRELFENEIAVERMELGEFPEEERHELELIYRAKGVPPEQAAELAAHLMRDPEAALDTMAREELGLAPEDLGSPWIAATSSFVAFALGAAVPLLPFLLLAAERALPASAVLSALALGGVGAGISLFTGRSGWWSALRMVLVGGFAAAVTYGVGAAVGVSVG